MTVFASIAEFEPDLIRECTGLGRAEACKRGLRFGSPSKLSPEQRELALRLRSEGKSTREVTRTFQIRPATFYRILSPASDKFGFPRRSDAARLMKAMLG